MGYIKKDYFKQGYISDVFIEKVFLNLKEIDVTELNNNINIPNVNYTQELYCPLYVIGMFDNGNVKSAKKVIVTGDNFIEKIANYLRDKKDGEIFEFYAVKARASFVGNNTGFVPVNIIVGEVKEVNNIVEIGAKIIIRTDKNEYEITPKIENNKLIYDIPENLKGKEFYVYTISQ